MDKLRQLYSYLLKSNLTYPLVLGLLIKAIATDVSYASFLLTIPALGFEAYRLYLKSKTPEPVRIPEEIQRELDQMKSKLNAVTAEKALKPSVSRYF